MSDTASPSTPPAPAAAEKKSKDRSPNYPAIGLRRALELAKVFWEHDKRQPVLVPRAATNLGFGAKSSGGLLAISAMKKYGLFDEEGTGDTRRVKLTETAIILLNPSADNRDALIQRAALKPAIHAELWAKFGHEGASDGTMRDYLVFERKFFDQAATLLIRQFNDTVAFAKLRELDKMEQSTEERVENPYNPPNPAAELRQPTQVKQNYIVPPVGTFTPPKPLSECAAYPGMVDPLGSCQLPTTLELPIPLDDGRSARIPFPMSEETFELLLGTLNLWKKKLIRPAGPQELF